jgi:hypothetical protein
LVKDRNGLLCAFVQANLANAANPDSAYPYPGATIGAWRKDVTSHSPGPCFRERHRELRHRRQG